VKFVFQDDQSNPSVVVQLVSGLKAKGVTAFLGPALTGSCLAAKPLIDAAGPVSFCFSNALKPSLGSFMFVSGPSTTDQALITVRYIRLRGWTKIGWIASVDANAQDGESQFDNALKLPENQSLSVVAREHFAATDVAVTAQIAAIKAAGAQVMIAYTTGTPIATVLRGANDAGLNIPVVSHAGNSIPGMIKQFEGFLPKELVLTGSASQAKEGVNNPKHLAAINTYVSELAALGEKPSYVKLIGWDPAMMLIAAYRSIGLNASSDQVRNALANMRGFMGVWGPYDMRGVPQRGLSAENVYMVEWDNAKGDFTAASRAGGVPIVVSK
jgi:branched-chain amino acid transport system substrate-binding protein